MESGAKKFCLSVIWDSISRVFEKHTAAGFVFCFEKRTLLQLAFNVAFCAPGSFGASTQLGEKDEINSTSTIRLKQRLTELDVPYGVYERPLRLKRSLWDDSKKVPHTYLPSSGEKTGRSGRASQDYSYGRGLAR